MSSTTGSAQRWRRWRCRPIGHARSWRATRRPRAALLDQLSGRIRATVGDVRIIVDDLGVPDLADHGFGPALEQLAERFRLGGLDVDLSISLDPDLDLPVVLEHAGYRIVGEALTNVARHSGSDWLRDRRAHG